ncbi:MAG: MbnP family protein [Flavobacteriales bacterium]
MKKLLLITLISIANIALSQKNVFLSLAPKFGNQDFQLLQNYTGNDGVMVEIEHFNYYLSDVQLFHDNGQSTSLPTNIWLITPTTFDIYLGLLDVNQIDSISFTIGVPKRYNTQSGALAQDISTYPETHPLSFQMPSMYWGWAFGYMHMIIGGKADSNNDNIPNSYFELHNLGNNNQQMVSMPVVQTELANQTNIHLNCHVDRWLNNITLASVGILHDETGLNITVMQNVLSQEVFTLDAQASIPENQPELFKWSFQNQEINIQGLLNNQLTSIECIDAQGKILVAQNLLKDHFSINTAAFPKGVYLLKISTQKGNKTLRIFI